MATSNNYYQTAYQNTHSGSGRGNHTTETTSSTHYPDDRSLLLPDTTSTLEYNNKKRRHGGRRVLLIVSSVISLVVLSTLLLAGLAVLLTYLILRKRYPYAGDELHWNWNEIRLSNIHFPDNFLWGVASSAHQCEGHNTNNQWYRFEQNNPSAIVDHSQCGAANDHYRLWQSDIALMSSELHLNSYRFSIEWSRVQPHSPLSYSSGVYNNGNNGYNGNSGNNDKNHTSNKYSQEALQHYHSVIDYMISRGIEPIVTIHHLTDPLWFTDMGSFEREENLQHFVEYGVFLFQEFRSKVKRWITMNGVNVYALQGYQQGVWPPGVKDSKRAAIVMKNMIQAHVALYHRLKELDQQYLKTLSATTPITKTIVAQEEAQVGLVLNMMQFDPYNSTNTLDRMISSMVNHGYRGCLLTFLSTGVFHFSEPGYVDLKYEDPKAIGALDFLGINYYGNVYAQFSPTAKHKFIELDKDSMTDMPHFPMYPEGIYRAIVEASTILKKPIMITENGIADHMDYYRDLFIRRYLYAVSKAISEGHNVIGYMHYTLTDSWEWNLGFDMQFGLYRLDRKTMERTLRKGAKAFIEIVKRARKL